MQRGPQHGRGEIERLLNGVEFEGATGSNPNLWELAARGAWLIGQMHLLSQLPSPPHFPLCG